MIHSMGIIIKKILNKFTGNLNHLSIFLIILETAVGREKDVQEIDVHRNFEKFALTLLVVRIFSIFLGASRACADFRDPTAGSRLNNYPKPLNIPHRRAKHETATSEASSFKGHVCCTSQCNIESIKTI